MPVVEPLPRRAEGYRRSLPTGQRTSADPWSDHLRLPGELRRACSAAVAAQLFKPRNQWPVEELIERCLATRPTPPSSTAASRTWSRRRRLLALIGHSRQPRWQLGNLVVLVMALGHTDGLQPILALFEAGLLFPDLPADRSDSGVRAVAGPGRRHRSEGLRPSRHHGPRAGRGPGPARPGVRGKQLHPATTVQEADGLEWPLRLAALWQLVAAGPLRRTQQGGFFKRDLDRLGPGPALAGRRPKRWRRCPTRPCCRGAGQSWKRRITARARCASAGSTRRLGRGAPPSLASLWAALPRLESWNAQNGSGRSANGRGNPYPSAYLARPAAAGAARPERWADPGALERWLLEDHPYWTGESVRPSQRPPLAVNLPARAGHSLRIVQATKAAPAPGWFG